jgi:hypothetical protein
MSFELTLDGSNTLEWFSLPLKFLDDEASRPLEEPILDPVLALLDLIEDTGMLDF